MTERQQESIKTYAFAQGRFAKAWALDQGLQLRKSPVVIFVKDGQDVREMAALPALQNNHGGELFDSTMF